MKDELKSNKKAIYTRALSIRSRDKTSEENAIILSVIEFLYKDSPEKILGDAYLDYINYRKEFMKKEFEKFYTYIQAYYPLNTKYMDESEKYRMINDIFKSRNRSLVDKVIVSRIAKEHFPAMNMENYREF